MYFWKGAGNQFFIHCSDSLNILFDIFLLGFYKYTANRTFLELSAGQSDWPEKLRGFVIKKHRRPVSFRHEEKQ